MTPKPNDFLIENLSDLLELYSPDIFYLTDFQARKYLYIGSTMPDYFGHNPNRIRAEDGMNFCFSLIHPLDLQAALDQIGKFEKSEFRSEVTPSITIEFRMRHGNGHYLWMRTREYIIEFNDEGKIKYTLGMSTCIDAKKKKEESVLSSSNLQETAKNAYLEYSEKKKEMEKISNREIQIMGLLTMGLSSKEIGSKLDISPETVEKHRTNIKRKLGVKNTAESINLFYKYKRFW